MIFSNFRLLFGLTVSCLILTTPPSVAAPQSKRALPPPTVSLFAHARKIRLPGIVENYSWKNASELVCFRFRGPQQGRPAQEGWVVYNLITKQETPMAVPELRSTLGVSPDGQWAVATDPQATDVFHWYLMPTFGKMRPFNIPASRFQNGIDDMALIGDVHPWMADNRHWVIVSDGGHGLLYATIFDRMRPDRWRRVEVKLPPQEKRIPNVMHRPNAPTYLVGFTPAGAAVVGSGDNNTVDRSVTLYEFALNRPQVMAKARRISLPVPAFPLPMLSPDGKSLVWRVVNKGAAGKRMEIWVSNRNGAHWRTAGYADPQDGRGDYPSALQWTPDSKHLSVIVGSGLSTPYDMYIIPAP